ncbi:MAG: hypothetical protein JWQ89_2699 [Devosia sp.]|uniref:hypothetical protein n=1 Tax=Devosia sp. TaxID=1871048 RepID=UPI002602CBBF|nr:hypothetical protein [Devosia sp.]MDB5540972.1 hypothetical protein [Devosia sp.]
MSLKTIARLAGVLALSAALAGCIDMTAEIDVQSETTGKATTTMTMGADFYPMIKQMADAGDDAATSSDAFCKDGGDVLTENADGSATCTSVKEGELATLTSEDGPNEDASFTVVSPGVVRVAFKTGEMSSQITQGEEQDAQTAAMMKAYFEGHTATIRIKGKRILDTNMTKLGDNGAEVVLKFTELLDGTAQLPPEYFAVVDTN